MPDVWLELSGYFGLFVAAFGAATLLPMQSEAVLVGLLLTDRYAAWALLTVATTGNVLGSALNWLLGRSIEVSGQRRQAGTGTAGLSSLWSLVATAQLGADHWRPTYRGRRRHARTFLELSVNRHPGQGCPLLVAGSADAGLGWPLRPPCRQS